MAFKKVKLKKIEDLTALSNDNSTLSFKEKDEFLNGFSPENENAALDPKVFSYISTLGEDHVLFPHAIESLKAQFKMHIKRNIIPELEGKQLIEALNKINKELIGQKTLNASNVSIYEFIAQKVKQMAPEAYKWYFIARSESAQTAGDVRLWVRNAVDVLDSSLQKLQSTLLDKSEETVKTIFPANANSQLYQPTSFGHHLLAFVEMFGRDRARFKDARDRINKSPFGSGEIVGNSFNINRDMVAKSLSFDSSMSNSVDAICSKDFLIEFVSSIATAFTTISRLAGEMISWHSTRNRFINFDSSIVVHSSVLPYKRDQLALESMRAKASKSFGSLMSLLSIVKDLPLEYSEDYKQMMEPAFSTFKDFNDSLEVMAMMVSNFTINRKIMKEASCKHFSTAQDLVDWIVQKSQITPDEASKRARDIINYAIEKDKKLSLLEIDEIRKFEPLADDDIYSVLIPSRAIISRRSGNGSNHVQIKKSIRAAKRAYL
ncbi:MAG: argininosuccinate lyase [Candidatus Midichloriaceae bacterium]|jgi:argininosuccinate lyase|nr:argininosuccinate lyase [Candidatus Midichloriaceae bacterium]